MNTENFVNRVMNRIDEAIKYRDSKGRETIVKDPTRVSKGIANQGPVASKNYGIVVTPDSLRKAERGEKPFKGEFKKVSKVSNRKFNVNYKGIRDFEGEKHKL